MPRWSSWLWRKIHALERRAELVDEVLRLKSAGRAFPPGIFSMIRRAPERYDDFVQMLCFLDPKDRMMLIDVGANVGNVTADFLTFFPNTSVFAFEPTSKPFDILSRRFAGDERIQLFRHALSNEEGERERSISVR